MQTQWFTGPVNLLALQIEQFGSRLRQALVGCVVDSMPPKTAGFNWVPLAELYLNNF
jgi:hypothetical protein